MHQDTWHLDILGHRVAAECPLRHMLTQAETCMQPNMQIELDGKENTTQACYLDVSCCKQA